MKPNLLILTAPLLAAAAVSPVVSPSGEIISTGETTKIVAANGVTVSVTPLSDDIFRVASFPKGATTQSLPASQSAVMTPKDTELTTFATPTEFIIKSPTTTVRINRADGNVSFFNREGNLLLSEAEGVDNASDVKTVSFIGDDDEIFYGAGERGHSLKLNGDSLVMFNRQNYGYTEGDPRISQMGITVPYFVSDAGYGILFDDYNNASLQLGDTIVYKSETPKPLSYYFINGDGTLAGATSNYTELTGRQQLPPFWTLGYVTSKYGYHNRDEALGAIDSLKTRGYPVDGIVFDLYWYGKETDMGRLEWNNDQWPEHKQMLEELKKKGVNTVLISQPYVNKIGAIDNYNMLSEAGMLAKDIDGKTHDVTTWVGDAGMIDVSNPATREWLWNRLKGLTEEGVAGWWGDLGEPEVHPLTIVHDNGETASQYHNVYGNEWSKLIYEGLRKDFPDMRPMLMMRGGTAGLQRYSVFPWTTDVSRSWGGFRPQVNLMLSAGLSGLGYMGSDVGGFAVDEKNPTDPELYVRWLQMGTFSPMLRTHAQLKPEPYHYPAQEELTRKFIKMRYEWLPYNYTLAYENTVKGYPLARPLNFNGKNPEKKYAEARYEYLWGDEVLVAPVFTKGARTVTVLFPEGEWINYNNPRLRYSGGKSAVVAAPLDQLPMFIKAGSFIPLYTEPIENVTQYNPQFLTVKYFPSEAETSYTLFDDDRKSPNSIADNSYQLTTFTGSSKGKKTEISISSNGGHYEGMPSVKMLTIEIVGTDRPKTVNLGDLSLDQAISVKAIRQYGWYYNSAARTFTVRFPWSYDDVTLKISK